MKVYPYQQRRVCYGCAIDFYVGKHCCPRCGGTYKADKIGFASLRRFRIGKTRVRFLWFWTRESSTWAWIDTDGMIYRDA